MAFVLGLAAIPAIIYGVSEMTNTMEDICNFNYTKYFQHKVENVGTSTKIHMLEIELAKVERGYLYWTNKYREAMKKEERIGVEKLERIKIHREYYSRSRDELHKQIRECKAALHI